VRPKPPVGMPLGSGVTRLVTRAGVAWRRPVLPAAEDADVGAIDDGDGQGVRRPRPRGGGRGLVVTVAACSLRMRMSAQLTMATGRA
jgi:hypothetical protein